MPLAILLALHQKNAARAHTFIMVTIKYLFDNNGNEIPEMEWSEAARQIGHERYYNVNNDDQQQQRRKDEIRSEIIAARTDGHRQNKSNLFDTLQARTKFKIQGVRVSCRAVSLFLSCRLFRVVSCHLSFSCHLFVSCRVMFFCSCRVVSA